MSRTKQEIYENRVKIAAALNAGKTYRQIQEELGVTADAIAKTKKIMEDPNRTLDEDNRENNSRPEESDPTIQAAILKLRAETDFGPRLLWAMMKREPEKFGIAKPELLPSPATIGRWIQNEGLAQHAIGPGDKRAYPIDTFEAPGWLAIDQHGPIHIKGQRLYLITINDRYTRLGLAIPFHHEGGKDQYIHAIQKANKHLLDGKTATALMSDNGVGVCPMGGWTAQANRYAMKNGTRIVFIPPAQPWKNGRLENWHYRMDKEFFQRVEPETTYTETIEQFTYWLNFYNMERPHSSLEYKAPADKSVYHPIELRDITPAREYPRLDPQRGIIDAIRLCNHRGELEFWGGCNKLQVSEVFAGSYLRTRFYCEPDDMTQIGEVIWQGGRNQEPITIATFSHNMDRRDNNEMPFIYNVRLVDFKNSDITPPPTTNLSERTDTTRNRKPNELQRPSNENTPQRTLKTLPVRAAPDFYHLVAALHKEGYREEELLSILPELLQEEIEKRYQSWYWTGTFTS
jgi:transposase InsO family protein